mgnify:CR=1 FL=1
MRIRRFPLVATGALALFAAIGSAVPGTMAQEATPVAEVPAEAAAAARPVHIHAGNCDELGDVVAPLTDLAGPVGAPVGQADRAAIGESSFTNVPLPLDAILAGDHAINAHLSAEEIGTYIACGEIGGILTPQGALIVGLRESMDSGFTGVAFLIPAADGASTDVSVFVAPVLGAAG